MVDSYKPVSIIKHYQANLVIKMDHFLNHTPIFGVSSYPIGTHLDDLGPRFDLKLHFSHISGTIWTYIAGKH